MGEGVPQREDAVRPVLSKIRTTWPAAGACEESVNICIVMDNLTCARPRAFHELSIGVWYDSSGRRGSVGQQ